MGFPATVLLLPPASCRSPACTATGLYRAGTGGRSGPLLLVLLRGIASLLSLRERLSGRLDGGSANPPTLTDHEIPISYRHHRSRGGATRGLRDAPVGSERPGLARNRTKL